VDRREDVMTVHTIRDWRGIKVQVGRCTTEELEHMRAEAIATMDHIGQFIAEVETELAERGEAPTDSVAAAGPFVAA
jgi:hypothetical protein